MKFQFKSSKKDVLKSLTAAEKIALHSIKVAGDSWIISETPVDTGNLRGSNASEINEDEKSVTFSNSAEYALWVHEGVKSKPGYPKQPFLRGPLERRGNDLKELASKAYRGL